MTVSYGEIVSRIQNTLNSVNKDVYIPRRYILSIFKSKAEFLMAQKFYDKSLYRETNLYDWLECVDMEQMDRVLCNSIQLDNCEKAVRTKKKLPKLIWTRYGSTILMVTNIDHSKEYKLVTQAYYNTLKSKKNFNKFRGNFAIVYPDNRLVIPDSTVKKINILLYSLDETSNELSNCSDSSNVFCGSYWDKLVTLSDKVGEVAIQETLKEVTLRMQIVPDENPQGDANIKSREQ